MPVYRSQRTYESIFIHVSYKFWIYRENLLMPAQILTQTFLFWLVIFSEMELNAYCDWTNLLMKHNSNKHLLHWLIFRCTQYY